MPSSNNPYDLVNALEDKYEELMDEYDIGIAASTSIRDDKSVTRKRNSRSDRR